MSALENYFTYLQGSAAQPPATVQAAYPATVAAPLQEIPQQAHPMGDRSNINATAAPPAPTNAPTADPILAAMAECPVLKQMADDHHTTQEILQVVQNSLNFILAGNKITYVPADEIQAAISEMAKHAEQFRNERKLNPSVPIARLRTQIGPGSQFAHRYHRHFEQHHPDHPATHEPHADGKPKPHIFGHDAQHLGLLNHEHEHHYGAPPEYIT